MIMNPLLRSPSQLPPMNINLLVFTDNPLGNCDESDRPPISESSGNKYWQNLPSLWFSSNHHPQEQRHHQNANALFPHQGNCASSSPERISSIKGVHHHLTASFHCTESVQRFAPHLCTESWLRSALYGKVLQKAALWSAPTAALCSTLVCTNVHCSCSAHTCHCARDSEGWTLKVFLWRKMNLQPDPQPFAEQSEGGDKWNQTSNLILEKISPAGSLEAFWTMLECGWCETWESGRAFQRQSRSRQLSNIHRKVETWTCHLKCGVSDESRWKGLPNI